MAAVPASDAAPPASSPPLSAQEVESVYLACRLSGDYRVADTDIVAPWLDDAIPALPTHVLPEVAMALVAGAAATGPDPVAERFLARSLGEALDHLAPEIVHEIIGAAVGAFVKSAEREVANAFLSRSVAEMVPRLSGQAVSGVVSPVISSLVGAGAEGPLAAYMARIVEHDHGAFVAAVNDPAAGRRRVVFVATRINYKMFREALYLRKNGHRAFLVSLIDIRDEIRASFAAAFDAIVTLPHNLVHLEALLQRLGPEVYHVHCSMFEYALGRAVIENKGDAACVCEVDDITTVYAEREVMYGTWTQATVDLDFAMESFICNRADGFVHQFGQGVEDELRERHGALPPAIVMQPYACPEFIAYGDDKPSRRDGVVRIVNAGAVCPAIEATPPHLLPGRSLPETVETLLEQGLAVDIVLDPSKHGTITYEDLGNPTWAAYGNLVDRYPRFRFENGVPVDEVARRLNCYDFGIVLLTLDPKVLRVKESKFRFQVAGKFYAYLEAGLPVIVNAEFETMARIVTEHDIGFAVHSSEIDSVAERIASLDYARMADNVKRFNERHNMGTEIARLIGLYDRVVGGRDNGLAVPHGHSPV